MPTSIKGFQQWLVLFRADNKLENGGWLHLRGFLELDGRVTVPPGHDPGPSGKNYENCNLGCRGCHACLQRVTMR